MLYAEVPTAADSEIVPLGDEVNHARIIRCVAAEDVGRAVRRVVIDDNEIEIKRRLLTQHRADCIFDRPHPIAHGDDDRSLACKPCGVECEGLNLIRRDICADRTEVIRACAFHLNLRLPIAGIYVIEDLLPALPPIAEHLGI